MLPGACGLGQHFQVQGHSFSLLIWADPKPVNNLFIFSKLSNEKKSHRKKAYAGVTVTVVRDRKIRIALRTNQIVGFVTMPAWKKKRFYQFFQQRLSVYDFQTAN